MPDVAGRAAVAALIAGGAWTIAGVGVVGAPTPPDWPGYLVSTLPVGASCGVVATLVAGLAATPTGLVVEPSQPELAVLGDRGRLPRSGRRALIVAVIGGPYGAVTGIAQSLAAIATVGMGLVLLRADAHPVGEVVLVAGAVMLLPRRPPGSCSGALWTGLGSLADRRCADPTTFP